MIPPSWSKNTAFIFDMVSSPRHCEEGALPDACPEPVEGKQSPSSCWRLLQATPALAGGARENKSALAMTNCDLFFHSKELKDSIHEQLVFFRRADSHTEPAVAAVFLAFTAQDDALGFSERKHFLTRLACCATVEQNVVRLGWEDDKAGDDTQ